MKYDERQHDKNSIRASVRSLLSAGLLFCFAASAGSAYAQNAAVPPAVIPAHVAQLSQPSQPPAISQTSQAVPDQVIYRFFFRHVETFDKVAEKLESQGKDGHGFRTHDQRLSGLTEDEGALVKRIAYDCNQALKNAEAKVPAISKAPTVQSLGKENPSQAETRAARANARVEINGIMDSYIVQLQATLGEASFQKLDKYVKSIVRPITMTPSTRQSAQRETKWEKQLQVLDGGVQ